MKVESFNIIDEKKKEPFKIIYNITEVSINKNKNREIENPKDNNISIFNLINDKNVQKIQMEIMKRIKIQINIAI